MAVVFDTSSGNQTFSSASSKSWTHTNSGTTNLYSRVSLGMAVLTANLGSESVKWDTAGANTSMVEVGHQDVSYGGGVSGRSQIFELINPAVGAVNVTLTFSLGANFGCAGSNTYTGVNQSVASGTAVKATGTSTAPSVTVTGTTSGNMISDALAVQTGSASATPAQTQRFNAVDGVGSYRGAGQDMNAPGGSQAMAWTLNSSFPWTQIAAEILAAGGGGGFTAVNRRSLGARVGSRSNY